MLVDAWLNHVEPPWLQIKCTLFFCHSKGAVFAESEAIQQIFCTSTVANSCANSTAAAAGDSEIHAGSLVDKVAEHF